VRPLTIERKNWLFSTSVDGANASMGIYTIVGLVAGAPDDIALI
jgi:hypothetical protein